VYDAMPMMKTGTKVSENKLLIEPQPKAYPTDIIQAGLGLLKRKTHIDFDSSIRVFGCWTRLIKSICIDEMNGTLYVPITPAFRLG